jgi:hypothetical protein
MFQAMSHVSQLSCLLLLPGNDLTLLFLNIQLLVHLLPLATFLALQSEPERALALSLVMLVVALAVLLPMRDRWLPGR